MSSEKPTVVIIGGGWHLPKHYAKVRAGLEAAGLEVVIPTHPSMNGARPPNSGLAEDTANTRAEVEKLVDAGKRVVAVGHSYGGQIASNALIGLGAEARQAKGLAGGVINIIYMCAFALPEGGSMIGFVEQMGHGELMPIAFKFDDDKTVLCADPKAQLIGDFGDPAEVEAYLASLVLWNGQSMYDTISSSAWRDIPATYIYTTADSTVPHIYQTTMVAQLEAAGRSVKTHELATGHCPNLTETDAVVDVIKQVAV